MLAIVVATPAVAEDFTFEVPLEVTNFAPGYVAVGLNIACRVSRVPISSGGPSFGPTDVVAEGFVNIGLGPGPVTVSRTVTIAMNARDPILRPASDGRSWGCNIGQIVINRPEGRGVLLHPGAGDFGFNYERATGYTIIRNVSFLTGEIVR
jgi:hypothetical protein